MTPDISASTAELALPRPPARRSRLRLIAAAVAVTAAIGGGYALADSRPEPNGASLPPVVLGESLTPLSVYERGADGLSPVPATTLHVQFAMLRHGPSANRWTLTLVAPAEASSGVRELGDTQRLAISFDGKQYPLGLSYPVDYDGTAVNFMTLVPDRDTALELANSITTSVVEGPPMGGLSN